MELHRYNRRFVFNTVYLIPLSIFVAKSLEAVLKIFNIEFIAPANGAGVWFVENFIGWFSVLYGILLPLILIKVWEQLNAIDREFSREGAAVRTLYKSAFYLQGKRAIFGRHIAQLLRDYVLHVIANYSHEVKGSGAARIMAGDMLLEQIEGQFQDMVNSTKIEPKEKESEIISLELIHKLNEIIDIRGNRIARSNRRLFDTLRPVALIASILFILPFYFVGFSGPTGLLDVILIIGITFLVIFIYMIIEDLDEPFAGTWKITDEFWRRVLEQMDSSEEKPESESLGKGKKGKVSHQDENKSSA